MRTAFKEWAIVVDALGFGRQIVILRKAWIHEGRGGFTMEHREFVLFPTRFHQQRESVLPAAQARFDVIAPTFPDASVVRLEFAARVEAWHRLESLTDTERLRGQHIWRDEVIAERFHWGRDQAIYACAVRVLRLPVVMELPVLPEYGGCKSGSSWRTRFRSKERLVLADDTFAEKLAEFHAALAPGTPQPA